MARIRTIKPEFWQDEKLARLPLGARLLFIGLWNMADDIGRLRGNPLFIRAQVFPYEPKADVETWLYELETIGAIRRYENGGEAYVLVVNFLKHQQISRPTPSRLPSPEDSGRPPVVLMEPSGETPEDSGRPPVVLMEPSGETPSGKERKGKEQGRDQGSATAPPEPGPPELVFSYWAEKLNHPRAILDEKRRKMLKARVDEGMTLDEGKAVVDGCLADIRSWPDRKRFDGIEYLFESRAAVEKFSGYSAPNTRDKTNARQSTIGPGQSREWKL